MFFWFTNDTFSIIDALLKLILVITGSALIICFCHKLTNYKKTRRYKSSSPLQHVLDNPLNHRQQLTLLNGTTTTGQFASPSQQQLAATFAATNSAHHLLAYDPYNTHQRQFACPTNQGQHLVGSLLDSTSAYNFPSAAAIDSLAAGELIRGSPQIFVSSNNNNNDINLISNPVYSSSASPFQLPLDCSTFQQAHRPRGINHGSHNNQPYPDPTADLCPSYEEAIAAGGGCVVEAAAEPFDNPPPNEADDGDVRSQTTRQSSEAEDPREEAPASSNDGINDSE